MHVGHTIDKMGGASAHQFTRRKVVLTLACTLWVGVDFRLVLSDKDAGRMEGGGGGEVGGAQYCTSGSDPTQVVTVIRVSYNPHKMHTCQTAWDQCQPVRGQEMDSDSQNANWHTLFDHLKHTTNTLHLD